jgi:excisionase family DNA binding protein
MTPAKTRGLTERGATAASHLQHQQSTQAPMKLLLTVEEACQALGIKRTVLYRLLTGSKGKQRGHRLLSVKVGSRRLIPVASLQAFVTSLCEGEEVA